jgi:ABC-type Zn uptake system ZnuABC Zn-binding protein ZnuA
MGEKSKILSVMKKISIITTLFLRNCLMKKPHNFLITILLGSMLILTACGPETKRPIGGEKLKVVATTSIVGDVVAQIGGDLIELKILLPVGTDPHSYDPNPQDVVKVAEADVIFANGAGLENFLDNLIESAGAEDVVMYLSEGVDYLFLEDDHGADSDVNPHSSLDPHTWTNPGNVKIWVDNIEGKLSGLDPSNAESYLANAERYKNELDALDDWIREQVAKIPEGTRQIITDHAFFGYFADEYGFEQIGALIAGSSTLAEPSAQEMANIEDTITSLMVKAVFVGNTVNPSLAERVAMDTGTKLVFIYTGSLGEPGSGSETYLEYMHYNTSAFVDSLK